MPDDDVLRRLAALEDERAILTTLYRYGHAIDYGLEDQWVDCFTEEGVFDLRLRVVGTNPQVRGRAALAAFISTHTRAPGRFHKHLMTQPMISITGDHASVESFFTRLDADDDGVPYIFSFGRYLDRLRRCADGVWRFEVRIAESDSRQDHAP